MRLVYPFALARERSETVTSSVRGLSHTAVEHRVYVNKRMGVLHTSRVETSARSHP